MRNILIRYQPPAYTPFGIGAKLAYRMLSDQSLRQTTGRARNLEFAQLA